MADFIKKVKIRKQDGTYTDYIPIGADARNVVMSTEKNLEQTIGIINVDVDGSIAEQLEICKDNINKDRQNYFTLNRIYRRFLKNGKYIDNDNNLYYATLQGATYIDNNKVLIACMGSNGEATTNNLVKLIEINIKTNEIIRESILQLNHCNSLAYDKANQILYAVSGSKYVEGVLSADYTLYKINYKNLNIITSKSFNEHISSVAYDNENQKLIVGYTKLQFYELNNNLEIVNTYNIEKPDYIENAGIQSIELHNNKLYCLTIKPDTIIVYDLETNSTSKIYSIPKYSNGGSFYIGEVEDLTYIGNNKFLMFSSNLTTYYSQDYQFNIFEFNLDTNVLDNNTYLAERSYLANNITSVFVNANSTSINPDGSSSKPFKEIYEAISFLNGPRFYGNGRIYVANGTYKNIFFYCNNIEIEAQNTANPNVIIQGVMANKSNISFENCKFIKNNTNLDYPIKIEKSNLLLSNATINSIDNYGIYSVESEINVRGQMIQSEDISSSNNKYMFYLDNGSILKMGQDYSGYKHIYFASQSAHILPSRYQLITDSTLQYGQINLGKTRYAIDKFKYITFKCLVNQKEQMFKFPTNINSWQLESSYMGDSISKINMVNMIINLTETGLEVVSNKWARYAGTDGNTWTINEKNNNTINNSFMILKSVELTNEP